MYVASSGIQVSTKESVQTFDLMSTDLSWVFGAKLQHVPDKNEAVVW